MKNKLPSTLLICCVTAALATVAGVMAVVQDRSSRESVKSGASDLISLSDGQNHRLVEGVDIDLGTIFMGESPA